MIDRRQLLTALAASAAVPLLPAVARAQSVDDVRAEVVDPKNAPVLGNGQGDVTLVEFFDYNCHFCRRNTPALTKVLAEDKGLRVIMREWPVFGPGSEFAAAAALAALAQRKYWPMHRALMGARGRIDEAAVLRIAKEVGLDTARLRADLTAPAVAEHLAKSERLANIIGLQGTPTFIVGEQMHFGLASEADLRDMIAAARR